MGTGMQRVRFLHGFGAMNNDDPDPLTRADIAGPVTTLSAGVTWMKASGFVWNGVCLWEVVRIFRVRP